MSEIIKRFTFAERMRIELLATLPSGNFVASGNVVEISEWQNTTIAQKNSIRALMQTNGLGEEPDIPSAQ